MAMIEVSGLGKRFGALQAVDEVSFSVERGEVVGFLGPNGAGKSTTMKMITGFLAPSAGTAVVCGHDVRTDRRAVQACLGYLPEGAPAYGDMPVGDFLDFVGKLRGMGGARRRDRIAEMVHRLQLAEVYGRRIETLSKGFKRRVGIAQALLHDPDVLILDEPTDGLDPNQKHEMRELIRGIAGRKAIVVSTHILEEVEAVCTRAIIIAKGRVVADATPAQLLASAGAQNAIVVTLPAHDHDRAMQVLAQVPGVAGVDVSGHVNGIASLVVRADGPQSIVQAVGMLNASGISVEDLRVERGRLDDVFRRITTH
ncbi:MAG TPA: ABC transporter ATP-binding protein [Azospirillaceae bacterium]|nr:ABC transporter ATP-binding protein [Azospirillaceae bacterium]